MIADHAVLATWREDDQFDPVALIQRGLRLARNLELKAPPGQRSRQASVGVKTPTVPRSDTQRAVGSRPGVKTAVQQAVSALATQLPEACPDQFATDWARLWWQRGQYKLQQQDYQGAQENFAKALQKWPQMAAAHNGLGIVFYHQGDFHSALAAFQQALEHCGPTAHVQTNLGSALYQIGDIVGAIAAYREALHINPKQAAAYYGLGVSLYQLQRYSEALTAYEQAIQLQPDQAECYAGLGRLLVKLGDEGGAIAAYRRAMQLNPAFSSPYIALRLKSV